MAAEIIIAARELVAAGSREQLAGTAVTSSSEGLRRHLVSQLGNRCDEHLIVIFLDRQRRFLGEMNSGTNSTVGLQIPFRAIIRRALDLGASRLIVAHNHPSGIPQASQKDIAATARLVDLAGAVEISVDDHLIIAGTKTVSMAAAGQLQ